MTSTPFALLFDLDGTLVDSEPGILASCEAAVRALGHRPAQPLSVAGLIGPPIEEVMAALLAPFGDDRVAEGVIAYRNHYGASGHRATTLYPGIREMIADLAARDIRLYVATSKRTLFARRILETLGLADRFAEIYGSEPGGLIDAKTELLAHVLARQGLAPERSLMIGDRRHDVAGAKANGLASIGVLWGYGDRDELETAGATHIATAPGEVVSIASGLQAA